MPACAPETYHAGVNEGLASNPAKKEPTTVKALRYTGVVEGISYLLLLFVAMPLKYLAGDAQYVRYVGTAHGYLFVMYIAMVIYCSFSERWSILRGLWLFIASVVPFGTFVTDRQLAREYAEHGQAAPR